MHDFKDLVPKTVNDFLIKHGKGEVLSQACTAVNVLSPESFLSEFKKDDAKLLSTGFNGVIFKGCSPKIYKISHLVLTCFSKADLNTEQAKMVNLLRDVTARKWFQFSLMRSFAEINVHAFLGTDEVGVTAPLFEVLGGLVWSAFSGESILLPDLMTQDGYGLRRPFVEGAVLKEILRKESKNGRGASGFDMAKIWKKISDYQRHGEKMLTECGCMVDLLNPGNFIVTGDKTEFSLTLIDTELVLPSHEARSYYQSLGISLPEPIYTDLPFFVTFPVMPEHIVLSRVWDLSFEQCLEYLAIFHECTEQEAMKRLSEIPEWKIEVNPMMQDYSKIRQAKALLA